MDGGGQSHSSNQPIEQIPLTLEEFKSLKKGDKLIYNEVCEDYGEEMIVKDIDIHNCSVICSDKTTISRVLLTLPSKWKFQKGDKVVRIIDNEKGCKVGNVYEIIKVSYQLSLKNCEGTYCNDCFRLADSNPHLIKSVEKKESEKNKQQPEDARFIINLHGYFKSLEYQVRGEKFKDNELSTKKLYLEIAIEKATEKFNSVVRDEFYLHYTSGFGTTPNNLKFTYGATLSLFDDGTFDNLNNTKWINYLVELIGKELDSFSCMYIESPFYNGNGKILSSENLTTRFRIGDEVRIKESSRGMRDGWYYNNVRYFGTIEKCCGYVGIIQEFKTFNDKTYVQMNCFSKGNYVLIDALELVNDFRTTEKTSEIKIGEWYENNTYAFKILEVEGNNVIFYKEYIHKPTEKTYFVDGNTRFFIPHSSLKPMGKGWSFHADPKSLDEPLPLYDKSLGLLNTGFKNPHPINLNCKSLPTLYSEKKY